VARANQGGKGDTGKLARKERSFMEKAARDNLAEVEAGKLAASKASSDSVKKFAEQMVQDHGKAVDELKSIAMSKGVDLPDATDRKHPRMEKGLEKKSGAEFDRTYMNDMVKEHQKDLKEFQKAAKEARDPEVKAYAEKGANMVRGHLDMARQVAAEVGASKGRSTAGKSERRDTTASRDSAPGAGSGKGG
jgi:putative membrane protein